MRAPLWIRSFASFDSKRPPTGCENGLLRGLNPAKIIHQSLKVKKSRLNSTGQCCSLFPPWIIDVSSFFSSQKHSGELFSHKPLPCFIMEVDCRFCTASGTASITKGEKDKILTLWWTDSIKSNVNGWHRSSSLLHKPSATWTYPCWLCQLEEQLYLHLIQHFMDLVD